MNDHAVLFFTIFIKYVENQVTYQIQSSSFSSPTDLLVHNYHGFLGAESDENEEASVPHEKILSCLTSCIHVAHIQDIVDKKKELMHIILVSLSAGLQWTGIPLLFLFSFREQLYPRFLCLYFLEFFFTTFA